MSDSCDHEYVQPEKDGLTGDTVTKCCDCERVLGFPHKEEQIDAHWFQHEPTPLPYICTAEDVINGVIPRKGDAKRYIHICGNCQHWMGAVHGGYFDEKEPPFDHANGRPPSFIGSLMESLCPKCGAANFRQTSAVLALSDAKWAENEGLDVTKFLENRADLTFWHSEMRPNPSAIEVPMSDVSDYAARCPCCGYAVSYGSRDFDFHHWDYEDDIGCQLCRDCHTHIHRDMRASEQAELTDGWRKDAIRRLYKRSLNNGLSFGQAFKFKRRYNIPVTPERLQWLQELVNDD